MDGLTNCDEVITTLISLGDKAVAQNSLRFFKHKPGEYGYGDQFLGIRMPQLRQLVKQAKALNIVDALALLQNNYHEIRMFALLLLNQRYKKAGEENKAFIVSRYVAMSDFVNNWDLVDCSAYHILGPFYQNKDRQALVTLAASSCIWQRRMSIVATYHFIKQGQFDTTLTIATTLLAEKEDIIHKAVGWMLKEIGKRDEDILIQFLERHHSDMPKTMFRFAAEKLSPSRKLSIKQR